MEWGLESRAVEDQVNGFAGRVEVIEGLSGRRSWPDDVKARIVRESLEPGASVSQVARRHRISPQQLTLWRRAARQGRLPVSVGYEKLGDASFVPLAIDTDRRTFDAGRNLLSPKLGDANETPSRVLIHSIQRLTQRGKAMHTVGSSYDQIVKSTVLEVA